MDIQRLIGALSAPTTTRSLRRLRHSQCAPSRTKKSKHGIRGAFGGAPANAPRLDAWKNSCEQAHAVREEKLRKKKEELDARCEKMVEDWKKLDPEKLKEFEAAMLHTIEGMRKRVQVTQ